MTAKEELAGRLLEYKASHRGDLHELLTEAAAALTERAGEVEPLGYVRAAGLNSLREGNHTSIYPAPREGYLIPVFAASPPPVQPVVKATISDETKAELKAIDDAQKAAAVSLAQNPPIFGAALRLREWRRRAEAAEARVKALEEGLEPFAKLEIGPIDFRDGYVKRVPNEWLTRARSLLDKPGGE